MDYVVDFEYEVPMFSSVEVKSNSETDVLDDVEDLARLEFMRIHPEALNVEVIRVREGVTLLDVQ